MDILILEDTLSSDTRMIAMSRKKQGQGSSSTITLARPLSRCQTCHFRSGFLTWGPRVYFEQGTATALSMWELNAPHTPLAGHTPYPSPVRRAVEVYRLAMGQKASRGRGHGHLFPDTVLHLQVKAICAFLGFLIVNGYVVVVFFQLTFFFHFCFFFNCEKEIISHQWQIFPQNYT